MMNKARRSFVKGALLAASGLVLAARSSPAATVKQPLPAVDLGFISSELTLVRRDNWSTILPRTWSLQEADAYTRITVHHSGREAGDRADSTRTALQIENILVGHMEKNYGDIAYHFILDGQGRVWEGRSLAYQGAHVSGENENNIGIMALGNYDRANPPERMSGSLDSLVSLLRARFQIKAHRLYGHRDLGHSICPGGNLYSLVREWRGF